MSDAGCDELAEVAVRLHLPTRSTSCAVPQGAPNAPPGSGSASTHDPGPAHAASGDEPPWRACGAANAPGCPGQPRTWTRRGPHAPSPHRDERSAQRRQKPRSNDSRSRPIVIVTCCYVRCSPDRIRTGATALRGRRPGPLDDGARTCAGFMMPHAPRQHETSHRCSSVCHTAAGN
jgi:hypothetical protein